MVCCRYLKFKYWCSSVECGKFKVGKPSDFEDNHDCAAYADGEISLEVIKKFSDSYADILQSKDIQDALQTHGITLADIYEKRQQTFKTYFTHCLLQRKAIDACLRVLCFFDDDNASDEDRYKMWRKYGDEFKGVRVFVDLDKLIGGKFRRVIYSESMPCCDLSQITDFPMCPYLVKFYENMVFTKMRAMWDFENEVRYIWSANESRQRHILWSDGDLEFASIPFNALVRVDFGCNVNMADCMVDVQRIYNSNLHKIEFRKMTTQSGVKSAYKFLRAD